MGGKTFLDFSYKRLLPAAVAQKYFQWCNCPLESRSMGPAIPIVSNDHRSARQNADAIHA